MGEGDGLEGGGMTQLGGAEPAVELALLAGRPLGVDEEADGERSATTTIEVLVLFASQAPAAVARITVGCGAGSAMRHAVSNVNRPHSR